MKYIVPQNSSQILLSSFGFVNSNYHPLRGGSNLFNANELYPHLSGSGIIIYGAGDNCIRFLTSLYLQNQKPNILCIADANKSKQGKTILGIQIISPNELSKYDKKTPILITPLEGFIQIADALESMQFSNLHYYSIEVKKCIVFMNEFLKKDENGKKFFNFNGILLPNLSSADDIIVLILCFQDTLLFHTFLNDNYDKSIVKIMDLYMNEGPYEYKDGDIFDVTIKAEDIIIDAGAWIGDFSALAAYKKAEVYAFEPSTKIFELLKQTAELNKPGKIHPVKMGLSNKKDNNIPFLKRIKNSAANSIAYCKHETRNTEDISITSIDEFVAENNIERVDFIKADIEGTERDMLIGATNTLKTFAPKLAICTYHLTDDPQVLESIILNANPNYKIVHLRHKLFACVV